MHWRIKELGVAFFCDTDLIVWHKKELAFGECLSQRYHYSKSFAGQRLARAAWWKRLLYAAATPPLPLLLFARITRTVWRKGRHRLTFLRATPWIGVFLVSWAWGEGAGALWGPGDSLSRVE